ncbi:hypothetical protein GCM10009617_13230 [Leifsonia poae]|uniref:Uncharacterized protein n=1 Tax=Leifsonia poae TaxID=110933 RepID=A0A9W6HAJ4_9MICO|nr:hypothetical protein GCM10017584_25450 [Leifsonia poae]
MKMGRASCAGSWAVALDEVDGAAVVAAPDAGAVGAACVTPLAPAVALALAVALAVALALESRGPDTPAAAPRDGVSGPLDPSAPRAEGVGAGDAGVDIEVAGVGAVGADDDAAAAGC